MATPTKCHPSYHATPIKGHPSYQATPTKGHPSYQATPTKGHPSYRATLTKGHPFYRATPTKGHPSYRVRLQMPLDSKILLFSYSYSKMIQSEQSIDIIMLKSFMTCRARFAHNDLF